jgi:drug/metabolite transporter (DMT)-like permease
MTFSGSVAWGLLAMLGWGTADYFAAVASRKAGFYRTFLWMQITSVVLLTPVLFLLPPDHLPRLGADFALPIIGVFVFACLQCTAYLCLYGGFQVGTVAVVSPIAASSSMITVCAGLVVLGEVLNVTEATGVALTLIGVVLTSTDFAQLKVAGKQAIAKGIPWGFGAMLGFGLSLPILATVSKHFGWFAPIYMMRLIGIVILLIVAAVRRLNIAPPDGRGMATATVAIALLDTTAFLAYSVGTLTGLVSVVAAASATAPLVTVILAGILLSERVAKNQAIGITVIVAGLVLIAT